MHLDAFQTAAHYDITNNNNCYSPILTFSFGEFAKELFYLRYIYIYILRCVCVCVCVCVYIYIYIYIYIILHTNRYNVHVITNNRTVMMLKNK